MTGWPHASVSFLPMARASLSAAPADSGTMMRSGLLGNSGVAAAAQKPLAGAVSASASKLRTQIMIHPPRATYEHPGRRCRRSLIDFHSRAFDHLSDRRQVG